MYAQLPRAHSFYGPVGGVHDPLLIVEAARQATFLACHAGMDVPLDSSFLMNGVDYRIDPEALQVTSEPAGLEILVDGLVRGRRRRTLSDMVGELHFFRDGQPAAQVLAKLGCVSAPVYRRLRAGRPAVPDTSGTAETAGTSEAAGTSGTPDAREASAVSTPVTPTLVGRDNGTDVVLSPLPGEAGWLLRVDRNHPVLFDHPIDHVAGMVIIEAMRQAAQFVRQPARVIPVGLDSVFHRFVEFSEDCYVRAEAHAPTANGDVPIHVTVEQGSEITAEGTVITRSCD
jgi:hypothetical protein